MNCILRGIRVLDPLGHLDVDGQDVWICDGRIVAIFKHIGDEMAPVVDLSRPEGEPSIVICPGFLDLHAHFREPGAEDAETVITGAMAAAAGGYSHVVTMADTTPPVDLPNRVAQSCFRAVATRVRLLTAAALTLGREGQQLVDMKGCVEAGAVAFSDDEHNRFSGQLLAQALETGAALARTIMVHPEDEEMIRQVNRALEPSTLLPDRPAAAEVSAIRDSLRALRHARKGRLHFQHVSTAQAVELIDGAKMEGLPVTAEVSPLHLGMWQPLESPVEPPGLAKLLPPLRSLQDRLALVDGLRSGAIDAVASDHSPHGMRDKSGPEDEAAPGAIGLETALSTCLTFGGMGGEWVSTLVERLTQGPFRVLGDAAGVVEPRLRIGEAATCVVFDPAGQAPVRADNFHSQSSNTPLRGMQLLGQVLLTIIDGAVVHHDVEGLPFDSRPVE